MASDRRPVPITPASSGFGQRLRAARQQRGITLQEIAKSTKIPVAMLEALENDKPSRLPGGIFSRAFVRSFASAVGLDPEEALAEFQRAFPEDGAPDERRVEEPSPAADGRLWPLLLLVAAVIGVVGLATAWYRGYGPDLGSVWQRIQGPPQVSLGGGDQATSAPPPTPAPAAPATTTTPAPPAAGEPAPAALTPAVPPPAQQPPPSPAPPPADGLVRLSIQPTGPCWVKVTTDGSVRLARLVAAGERVEFSAASSVQLEVGDAGAFAYTLNGRPGRPLGAPGRVVRVTIDDASAADFVAR